MKQVKETLSDIDILDRARHTAEDQLINIRRSATNIRSMRQDADSDESQVEEARLTLKIENLQSEKSHLTNMLPSFRIATCSDDELGDTEKDDQEQQSQIQLRHQYHHHRPHISDGISRMIVMRINPAG